MEYGDWMYGYQLQGKSTKWGFSGVDADTRAHELARDGHFDSPNHRYVIQHRRKGKYAQFRAIRQVTPHATQPTPESNETFLAQNKINIEWFNSLPVTYKD